MDQQGFAPALPAPDCPIHHQPTKANSGTLASRAIAFNCKEKDCPTVFIIERPKCDGCHEQMRLMTTISKEQRGYWWRCVAHSLSAELQFCSDCGGTGWLEMTSDKRPEIEDGFIMLGHDGGLHIERCDGCGHFRFRDDCEAELAHRIECGCGHGLPKMGKKYRFVDYQGRNNELFDEMKWMGFQPTMCSEEEMQVDILEDEAEHFIRTLDSARKKQDAAWEARHRKPATGLMDYASMERRILADAQEAFTRGLLSEFAQFRPENRPTCWGSYRDALEKEDISECHRCNYKQSCGAAMKMQDPLIDDRVFIMQWKPSDGPPRRFTINEASTRINGFWQSRASEAAHREIMTIAKEVRKTIAFDTETSCPACERGIPIKEEPMAKLTVDNACSDEIVRRPLLGTMTEAEMTEELEPQHGSEKGRPLLTIPGFTHFRGPKYKQPIYTAKGYPVGCITDQKLLEKARIEATPAPVSMLEALKPDRVEELMHAATKLFGALNSMNLQDHPATEVRELESRRRALFEAMDSLKRERETDPHVQKLRKMRESTEQHWGTFYDAGGYRIESLRKLDDEAVLLGVIYIVGAFHHIMFIQVHEVDRCQEAVNDPHGRLRDVYELNDESMETVRVSGFPGDYVMVIYPRGE